MLCKFLLSIAFISVTLGQVVVENSQTDKIEGKGLTWDLQALFDVYFNKTFTDDTEDLFDYGGGNIIITGDGGNFFNPPSTAGGRQGGGVQQRTHTATMLPDNDVVQIKLTINKLEILDPVEGDCVYDRLEITGANPGLEIPTLCGLISDQILYIDIDNSDGPYQLILTTLTASENPTAAAELRAITRFWDVSIDYLREADAVPRRCLQYHTAKAGTIKSFNYGGEMLSNLRYAICFGYVAGRCDVAFTFTKLDLGGGDDGGNGGVGNSTEPVTDPVTEPSTNNITEPSRAIEFPERRQNTYKNSCEDDFLLIVDDKYCREYTNFIITAKATGPIIVGVRSGMINDMEAEGFSATYIVLGC